MQGNWSHLQPLLDIKQLCLQLPHLPGTACTTPVDTNESTREAASASHCSAFKGMLRFLLMASGVEAGRESPGSGHHRVG